MTKTDELAIERGLQIKEFPSKWVDAKDLALLRLKHYHSEESAFELACRFFLELGAETSAGYYDLLEAKYLDDILSKGKK